MSKRKKAPVRIFVLLTEDGDVYAFKKAKSRKAWLESDYNPKQYTKANYVLEVK